jgi:hypothetical protein
MLKAGIGFAGIGLIMLGGIAIATPAAAQGVYVDTPGVSVGVGTRHHYRDRDYRYRYGERYRYRGAYAAGNCRTKKIIRSDGSSTTIRRCN